MADVEPSEAYCGLAIGDRLFVLEFEGHQCVAAVHGGNPIDLDFVLAGSTGIWQKAVHSVAKGEARNTLTELVEKGALEIQSEDPDGKELVRCAVAPGPGLGLGREGEINAALQLRPPVGPGQRLPAR